MCLRFSGLRCLSVVCFVIVSPGLTRLVRNPYTMAGIQKQCRLRPVLFYRRPSSKLLVIIIHGLSFAGDCQWPALIFLSLRLYSVIFVNLR